jgi:hypothetical protein
MQKRWGMVQEIVIHNQYGFIRSVNLFPYYKPELNLCYQTTGDFLSERETKGRHTNDNLADLKAVPHFPNVRSSSV